MVHGLRNGTWRSIILENRSLPLRGINLSSPLERKEKKREKILLPKSLPLIGAFFYLLSFIYFIYV